VFVVNKADRDGAETTVREIRHMISLGDRTEPGLWRPPVLKTVADRGVGVGEVMEGLDKHLAWMRDTGELDRRRLRRATKEVEAIALARLRERMGGLRSGQGVEAVAREVVDGTLDPYAAADRVVSALA
jgi:LAO/AO transport system kinase